LRASWRSCDPLEPLGNGEGGLSPDSRRDLVGRGDIHLDVTGRESPKTSPKTSNASNANQEPSNYREYLDGSIASTR
jgi:hypothetical protein